MHFAAAAFVLLASTAVSQDHPFTVRVDVPLVSVDVTVVDDTGKPMTDLSQDDFAVYEDGVLQDVRVFEPATAPFNALLLFDCSFSTNEGQPLFSEAAARFAETLRPDDGLTIAAFGSRVELLFDLGSGKREPLDSVRGRMCFETKFYDALEWAVKRLKDVDGRKGVIVYTDGRDTDAPTKLVTLDGQKASVLVDADRDGGFKKILKKLTGSRVPFYFAALNTDRNPYPGSFGLPSTNPVQSRLRMEQLAEASGGRVIFPSEAEDVIPFYRQIGRDLRVSYTLAYSPTRPWSEGGRRRIEVRERTKGAQVWQSRDEYFPR